MTIVCSRCSESREAVGSVPVPGELGARAARSVCVECWSEWVQASIRVVNHYHLMPTQKEHREMLFELMREFLKLPAA